MCIKVCARSLNVGDLQLFKFGLESPFGEERVLFLFMFWKIKFVVDYAFYKLKRMMGEDILLLLSSSYSLIEKPQDSYLSY